MNKKSNFFNLLDKIEQATSRYTMAHIEQAMAHMGVVCKLYRKKKERTTDEVYGIHGGSELSRLPSTSIYDQPFSEPITEENLGDIDIDNFNAGIIFGILKHGITRADLERGLTEEQWDKVIECALAFSTDCCKDIFNYVSKDFGEKMKLSHS